MCWRGLVLFSRASRENPTLAEKKKSSIWQLWVTVCSDNFLRVIFLSSLTFSLKPPIASFFSHLFRDVLFELAALGKKRKVINPFTRPILSIPFTDKGPPQLQYKWIRLWCLYPSRVPSVQCFGCIFGQYDKQLRRVPPVAAPRGPSCPPPAVWCVAAPSAAHGCRLKASMFRPRWNQFVPADGDVLFCACGVLSVPHDILNASMIAQYVLVHCAVGTR